MDYEYVTLAKFRINGIWTSMEITREDEEKDFQFDPDFPDLVSCLASNAYWALVTLEAAGKIEDLSFTLVKKYSEESGENLD